MWRHYLGHLLMPLLDEHLAKPQPLVALRTLRGLRYDFFISYRHGEAEAYAARLAARLQQAGFRVYFASDVEELRQLDDDALHDRLEGALHSSAAIVHILSEKPFDGEYTRWESDVFYSGRFGLTIGIITEVTSDWDHQVWRGRRQMDSVLVYEETDGAWASCEPSITTVLNLAVAHSLYLVLLRTKVWIWLFPRAWRRHFHDARIDRADACRRWIGMFLVTHGLIEPPEELRQLLERTDDATE